MQIKKTFYAHSVVFVSITLCNLTHGRYHNWSRQVHNNQSHTWCHFHFMCLVCLICHGSSTSFTFNSSLNSKMNKYFSYKSTSIQCSWKFFISIKYAVLYIIRTEYKAQCISTWVTLFGTSFFDKLNFLVLICHLDGPLPGLAPSNLQVTFQSTYFLNVPMFLQLLSASRSSMRCLLPSGWPHTLFYGFAFDEIVNCAANAWPACLQHFLSSRHTRLTVFLIIVWQIKLILINA